MAIETVDIADVATEESAGDRKVLLQVGDVHQWLAVGGGFYPGIYQYKDKFKKDKKGKGKKVVTKGKAPVKPIRRKETEKVKERPPYFLRVAISPD